MEDNEERQKPKHVGSSFIGSKQIFRMIHGPKDYRPLCLCKHETEEEALACEEALARHKAGETAV